MSHITRTYNDGRVETLSIDSDGKDGNHVPYEIKYDENNRVIYHLEKSVETFYSYDSDGNESYKKINMYEDQALKHICFSSEHFYKYNHQGMMVYEKNVYYYDDGDSKFKVFTYDYLDDGVTLHMVHENGKLRERYTYDPETMKLIISEDISDHSSVTTTYSNDDDKVTTVIKHSDGIIHTTILATGIHSDRTEFPDGKIITNDNVYKEIKPGTLIFDGYIHSEYNSDGSFEIQHYNKSELLTKIQTHEYTDEYCYD